jgi:hypothetical protein
MPADTALNNASRVVAIVAKKKVLEVWHIQCQGIDHRESQVDFHTPSPNQVGNDRRGYHDISGRRLARQEWGHFLIERHHPTRIRRWTSLGLMMLIPGTLLAAGSANQGLVQIPTGLLILQFALITIGSLLTLSSGWRTPLEHWNSSEGVSLESIGVSSQALGFPSGVLASESLAKYYGCGRLKGAVEIDAPLGDWNVVEE